MTDNSPPFLNSALLSLSLSLAPRVFCFNVPLPISRLTSAATSSLLWLCSFEGPCQVFLQFLAVSCFLFSWLPSGALFLCWVWVSAFTFTGKLHSGSHVFLLPTAFPITTNVSSSPTALSFRMPGLPCLILPFPPPSPFVPALCPLFLYPPLSSHCHCVLSWFTHSFFVIFFFFFAPSGC